MLLQQTMQDDLLSLLDVLPPHISGPLMNHQERSQLLEVILDLGRKPEARFVSGEIILSDQDVTEEEILYVVNRIGVFGGDNRAGIARTLHRISAIRNRAGKIVGLTCRVGRAVYGTIKIIEDLIQSGKSLLLLGRPGVGKTTMLREVARVLADDLKRRVVVVDSSNEIAGDGDIPHPAIGRARRMQVQTPDLQHAVMIEAVENHMPEVIIIDEIGTELEAAAARTIAERGVQLVGTAHGNTLDNLIMNPTLSDLVGGIQSVTLGDEEARRRGTQKSVLERKAPPTFDMVVEIQSWTKVAVHEDVAGTVDVILRGRAIKAEVREIASDGAVQKTEAPTAPPGVMDGGQIRQLPRISNGQRPQKITRVYPFGVNRARVEQAIKGTQLPVALSDRLDEADALLTLRNYFRRKPQAIRDAESRGVPVYVLKSHTQMQIEQGLLNISQSTGNGNQVMQALREAEDAVHNVIDGPGAAVELMPQSAYLRRLQHQVAQRYNLQSRSTGREPHRRVQIFRGELQDAEY